METKIKKFLWFDLTSRQRLYIELAKCYDIISDKTEQIESLENILTNAIESRDQKINMLNNKIKSLNDTIKELANMTNTKNTLKR